MTLFASAASYADARANRVRVFACTVATFALTEFFVVFANLRLNRDRVFGACAAVGSFDAYALFVFQETGFAKASNDALSGAERARMGIGAGGCAGGAARHEDFVFFALRNFRRVGEEHVVLSSFAFASLHADALSISQMTFFAEASNDALFRAQIARMRISAGWCASRSARVEFFVGWALRNDTGGVGFLDGNIGHIGLTLIRAHANALSISQMTFFAKASNDALFRAHIARMRVCAGWCASRSARVEFFVGWALRDDMGSVGFLDGNIGHIGLTLVRAHANAFGVFQKARLAETTGDT
jgi:hypothetical protein